MNTRMDEETAPKRGRPARQQEEQRRRKNRGGVTGQRLGVNASMLDFKNYVYRWINDRPARMFAKTKEDDWDIVHQEGGEVKAESDLGSAVSFVVGTNPDGSPMRAYLCRKRRAWYDADQEEKKRELEEQLAEMRRGNDRHGGNQADYVPNAGIRI